MMVVDYLQPLKYRIIIMAQFLIETYRILSLTDWDEYIVLTGQAKKEYNLIISAGKVDLSEGSLVQTRLWGIFPQGTVTGDTFRDVNSGLMKPLPIKE